MSTFTETITPAKAQEYLKTSLGNRPISKTFVRSYSDTMKRGGWLLNGEPIIFDINGHLVEGHHRLLAVIEANIPVAFDVKRGVPPESFTTYDNGRHRTVGQLLAMQGVKHYNLIGSIINTNARLLKSGRLFENNRNDAEKENIEGNGCLRRTNDDNYNLYRDDKEGYDHVAEEVVRLQSRCRIISAAWVGGLIYYLTHTGGYTEEEVLPFFEALHTLESDAIPVVSLLRKAITKEALEGRKMKAETLWAFITKSWNAYVTGNTPKILRYQEREETPALLLR